MYEGAIVAALVKVQCCQLPNAEAANAAQVA